MTQNTQRLPLFESFAAVAAVGLVAALAAMPTSNSAEESDLHLMDQLSLMRTAIFRFSMDHSSDVGPLWPGQGSEQLTDQLTDRSRSDGSTWKRSTGRDDRWFGPYLDSVPANPVNYRSDIRLDYGSEMPIFTGQAGWVYQPLTGTLWPDLPGQDPRGILYAEY